ncbi:hypothetical protein GCM10022234_10920 [Aeromicrobium panaciterrae]|uniref:hypothetical protein n=1 Tax=Aeromicrobium panaciterrae TaxID=363861 RepID=UPI0031D5F7F2
MSPKKTTQKDEVEASAPEPALEAETVEVPAAAPVTSPAAPRYSRGAIAAGVAGLLAVGGVAGFAIGRETGDGDVPRITQVGGHFPGQGPVPGGPQMRRNDSGDQRGQLPQLPDQRGEPLRQDSGGDVSGT